MELHLLERQDTKLMQPGASKCAPGGEVVGGHALATATCHLLKAGSACGPTTLSIFCGEKDTKSHAARTLALLFRRRDRAPTGDETAAEPAHPGHIVGAMCTFVVHHIAVTASESRLRAPRPVIALELVTLVTLPELRTRGVAELMLAAVQAVASALGGARALVVNVMSEHATEFFRQSGFRSAKSSRAFALDSNARLENGAARDLRAVFDCPRLCLPFQGLNSMMRIGFWRSRRDVPARASQTARASDDESTSEWEEERYEDETDTDEENAREDEDELARFRAMARVARRVRATDTAAAVTAEAPGLCLRRSDVVLASADALKLRAPAAEWGGTRLGTVPRGSAQDCLSTARDPTSKVRAASVIARSTWQPSPRSVTRGGGSSPTSGEAPGKPPPKRRAAARDAAPPKGKVTRAEALSRWGAIGLRPKHLQQLKTTEFAVKGKKSCALFDAAEIEALLITFGVLQRGIVKEQPLECDEPCADVASSEAVDAFDSARARLLASGHAWYRRVRSLRYEPPYVPSMGRRAQDETTPKTPRSRKPASARGS